MIAGKYRRTTSRSEEFARAGARCYAERKIKTPSRLQRDGLIAPHNPALGIRRPVTLAPEPGEPDAGFLSCPAAHQADGRGLQADAEDFADPLEILIDRVPPVVVWAEFAIPAARPFLGRNREFGELVDGGADDLRCRNGAAARG